jgi:hypothetical protein
VDAMREEGLDDSGLAKIRPFAGGSRGISRVFCALSIDGAMVKASEGDESAARKRQTVVPLILVILQSTAQGPASVPVVGSVGVFSYRLRGRRP